MFSIYMFRKMKNKIFVPLLMLMAVVVAACSESDDDVEEYVNWQEVNDSYWSNLYATTKQRIADGDASWLLLPKYSLIDNGNISADNYVVVHKLESVETGESPLFSDTVLVHYAGRLLPSTSYSAGFRFDSSYGGNYDASTSRPTKFAVATLVEGWQTALQHMRKGEHWEVYIPYNLGSGTKQSESSAVPSYSTLIFDLRLVDFWHAGEEVEPLK